MEDLDYGITPNKSSINNETNLSPIEDNEDKLFNNPLYSKTLNKVNNEDNEDNYNLTFLARNYRRVLVACLIGNKTVDNLIYKKIISKKLYNTEASKLILFPINLKILKNILHYNNIIQIDSENLEQLNHMGLILEDTELVLPILNISFTDLYCYLRHYDGFFDLNDVYNTKLIEQYFSSRERNSILSTNYETIISNIKDSEYWSYYHNCMLNMTLHVMKRNFNLHLAKHSRDETVNVTLKNIQEVQGTDHNYLQFIMRPQKYIDASCAIKKKGYRIYKILNYKLDFTHADINSLFDQLPNEIQKYKLFNNLIISKKYCHLVVNNKYLLDKLNPMIEKYIGTYRYILGYAWLTFYLEESIKRSHIETNDRFIFDIETASKLPHFPVIPSDLSLNPYLPIMIKKDVLNGGNNCLGFPHVKTDHSNYGITTLEKFKKNLNIYTTGKSDKSIFENMNWDNLAISGSTLAACIQKRHPLISLFEATCQNDEETFFRYCNEYYANADIDIMCNCDNKFSFMDTVFKTYETVKKNLIKINPYAKPEHVKMIPHRKAAIIINEKFIRKYIVKNDCSYEYILSHLQNEDIINMFYPFYQKAKEELNEDAINDKSEIEKKLCKEYYKDYFEPIEKENLVILFSKNNEKFKKATQNIKGNIEDKIDYNFLKEKDELIHEDDNDFDLETDENWEDLNEKKNDIYITENDTQEILFKVNEGLKYKIESAFLNHSLEIFQIKYSDFFSTVSRFHLPCVRGYYNGDNVYLLPSCISAHMTFINMDYKYFAGAKDPIEIINKYRMRGFGTILNDQEKLHLVDYSSQIPKWKNLYSVDVKNPESVKKMFGHLGYDHRIYKPRLFNSENYHDCNPVSDNYNDINFIQYITNINDYKTELARLYNYNNSHLDEFKFNVIKESGYVNPVKKWVLDAIWDMVNDNV
jgi:hypothetical protein